MNQVIKNRFRSKNLSGLLFLICIESFWFLSAFPGNLSPDSLDSWNQVQTNIYFDWHPVIFQIYMSVLSLGGRYLFLISLFQLLITSLILIKSIKVIAPTWELNKVYFAVGIVCATPYIGPLQVTLWKDVPYSFITILGIAILADLKIRKSSSLLLGSICLIIGALFRHDGWVTLLVIGVFLLIQKLYINRKSAAEASRQIRLPLMLVGLSIIALLAAPILVGATSAAPIPSWAKTISLASDVAWVASKHPEALSKKDFAAVQKINLNGKLDPVDGCSTRPFQFLGPNFSSDGIREFSPSVVQIWLKLLTSKYGFEILKSHYCLSQSFIPFPLSISAPKTGIEWISWGIAENHVYTNGLIQEPVVPIFRVIAINYTNWFTSIFSSIAPSILGWPSLLFSISMILYFLLGVKRKQGLGIQLLFLISASRIFTLIIMGPNAGFRYALIVQIVFLLFAVLYLEDFLKRKFT